MTPVPGTKYGAMLWVMWGDYLLPITRGALGKMSSLRTDSDVPGMIVSTVVYS